MKKKMDVVVSFDTTGSMYPCLTQVRREVENFIGGMFKEFKELRIGIIAHGDYCDKDNPYTIIYKELSRDAVELSKFVRNVDRTYGGDADECYELVLNLAHSDKMNWREDADKIFIMIGDASPHSPRYPENKDNLDWMKETEGLARCGIKVFAVHALAGLRSSSRGFYKRVAEDTMGVYLTLDQFSDIIDLIKATVYQQSGEEKLSEFITIIKDSGRLTRSMDRNIRRLQGEKVADDEIDYYSMRHSRGVTRTRAKDCEVTLKEMGGLVPVVPGRFQVMTVDENCDIKGFVTKNGIEFKKGRGFYELTKAETVQQYKEVIMQDRETGEMFNGSQVREKLHLQPQSERGGVNERLHAADAKEFRIFVQSTSVNRKLIAGTTFLYEIPDMEDTGTTVEDIPVAKPVAKKSTTKKTTKPKKDDKVVEEATKVEEKDVPKDKKKSTTKKKSTKKEKVETKEERKLPSVPEEVAKAMEARRKAEEEASKETETVESVEFSEIPEETSVLSASNKDVDKLLKHDSTWLEEAVFGSEPVVIKEETKEKHVEPKTEEVITGDLIESAEEVDEEDREREAEEQKALKQQIIAEHKEHLINSINERFEYFEKNVQMLEAVKLVNALNAVIEFSK